MRQIPSLTTAEVIEFVGQYIVEHDEKNPHRPGQQTDDESEQPQRKLVEEVRDDTSFLSRFSMSL